MKQTAPIVATQKRGSTPSAPKNNPGTLINVTRKIVDATVNTQPKKNQIIVPNTCNGKTFYSDGENRIFSREENYVYPTKQMAFYGEKQSSAGYSNNILDSFKPSQAPQLLTNSQLFQQQRQGQQQQMQQQQQQLMSQQQPQQQGSLLNSQNQIAYQPFGVQDQEKLNSAGQKYPSPQFPKKADFRSGETISIDAFKELQQKYENISARYEEMKGSRQKMMETIKQKDEKLKQCEDALKNKDDTIKSLKIEISLSKRRNQELIRQGKVMKEQLTALQNEERRENQEHFVEMMYALRMHQQEEQQLQMAIQQSAEDAQDDPNFINVDNMTYEELLELEEQNGKVSRGLDQEIIDNLPIVKFTNRLKQQQERCTICISDFEVGEELKQLPCRHIYHLECVDSWLKQEKKCPVCKGEVDTSVQQTE